MLTLSAGYTDYARRRNHRRRAPKKISPPALTSRIVAGSGIGEVFVVPVSGGSELTAYESAWTNG
jgi:hypothetical protein